MKRNVPMTWGAVVAVLALSTCGLAGCGSNAAPDAKSAAQVTSKAALTVSAVTPTSTDWTASIPASGNIAAWQETIVGSEIGGLRLTELAANLGDQVRRNQLLATLAADTVLADLAQARAGVKEAEAAFAEARANGDRARKFDGTGAISQQQSVQYLTAEETARARIDVAKARLQAEELRLSKTRVLAPDDAVVATRAATVGTVVQAGQELFRLILRGRLEWRAEVAAAELARIKPGAVATLSLPSGGTLAGKVRVVAPAVDAQTRNGLVYVDLITNGEARAGMFARGEIALGQGRALTLPQSAVLLRDGFAWAFRIGADRKVAQVKLSTGRRAGDRVEILGGLTAQDRVVESGVGFLADGDLVDVVERSAAAPAVGTLPPPSAAPKS